MKRLLQRSVLLQTLLLMLTGAWCTSVSSNTITVDDFLLLDNTLLLNAGLVSNAGSISVRSDFGREQIRDLRALGVRRDFGREMLRMGREFSLYLGARGDARRTYTPFLLREARTLGLRREASTRLSLLSVRKTREVLGGQYLLGVRETDDCCILSLFANFSILDDTMIWTVSDKSGDSIFAMSSYKKVPEPGTLLLLIAGLIGLILVAFYRPKTQQQLTS